VRPLGRTQQKAWNSQTLVIVLAVCFLLIQAVSIYYDTTWRMIDHTDYLILESGKLIVARVGKLGWAAGFRMGDRLVRLAGEQIETVLDYRWVLSRQTPGQEVSLIVRRDNEELPLAAVVLQAYVQALRAGMGLYYAPRYWRLNTALYAYLIVAIAMGLVGSAYRHATTSRLVVKRQLQWIMWGLGCAALVTCTDVALTLSHAQTSTTTILLPLAIIPLPVAFGFAILRYRLLDVDLVLSRSVIYGALTAGLLALYLFLVSVLPVSLAVVADSREYIFVLFISAFIVGVAVTPLRTRIQAFIDGIFFRSEVDLRRALVDWSEELSTSIRFADVAGLLIREVPQ